MPRFRRLSRALAAGLALSRPLLAREPLGNALMLFDSYLAQAALIDPIYRADLKAGADPGRVPPGRLLGESPVLGPFTYRPKTWGELSRAERAGLLRDPGFRAFLIATGVQAGRQDSPVAVAERGKRREGAAFSIEPGEMLLPRAVRVAVPPP